MTTGGNFVWNVPVRSPDAELADSHRALLKIMAWDLVVQEVERRGWRVCVASSCRYDRLPDGYPPYADDDLPFDGEDRRL